MLTVGRYNERSIGGSDERRRPDLRLAPNFDTFEHLAEIVRKAVADS
jgi:hypothetical protein